MGYILPLPKLWTWEPQSSSPQLSDPLLAPKPVYSPEMVKLLAQPSYPGYQAFLTYLTVPSEGVVVRIMGSISWGGCIAATERTVCICIASCDWRYTLGMIVAIHNSYRSGGTNAMLIDVLESKYIILGLCHG
jgi:hypothetical protein